MGKRGGLVWRLCPTLFAFLPALLGSGLTSETSTLFCSVRRRGEVFVAARQVRMSTDAVARAVGFMQWVGAMVAFDDSAGSEY